MVKDIRLIIKSKNNRLFKEREKLGFNQVDMAKFVGISTQKYTRFENMQETILDRRGNIKKACLKIATRLMLPFDYLFPEHLKGIKTKTVVKEISFEAFALASGNYSEISANDVIDNITSREYLANEMLEVLSYREKEVIKSRFGFNDEEEKKSLQDIAVEQDVTKERIRQIEKLAIMKIRRRNGINIYG